MSNSEKALTDIRVLEELSLQHTFVHRRHPVALLLVTLGYVAAVASYAKYELGSILPMLLYPVFVSAMGEIPLRPVLKRVLPALPLVLGVGALNPVLDHNVVIVGGMAISAGWLSLASIVLRCVLSVVAALLLVAVAGMGGVATALRSLKTPKLLVTQFTMTFRYLHVLAAEAGRMALAYRLRAPHQRGVAWRHWGSFAGQWLLRSLDRAERLHRAMLCRGFSGQMPEAARPRFCMADLAWLLGWLVFFAAARFIDIPRAIGTLILTMGAK